MRLRNVWGGRASPLYVSSPGRAWWYLPAKGSQVLKIQQEPQAIPQPASPVSMSQPRPEGDI